jgi:hypothetical protein
VYDREGWHAMPYLDQGEFFSEYGAFEVRITLPSNYVVGATGELQEAEERIRMEERAAAFKVYSKDLSFPPSDSTFKTITFKQDSIHDFAWFADKRFHVKKGSVILPDSRRKVVTWALYTNSEPYLWENCTKHINDAIYYYSKWIGDYPYAHCTAIDGTIAAGGGMEYPMITILGKSYNPLSFEIVTVHEVGHNWFYGILGSNERRHPWLDEGINSHYEARYILTKYPPEQYGKRNELQMSGAVDALVGIDRLDYHESGLFEYLISASSHTDQPIAAAAADLTPLNYGTITYKKSALAMYYLQEYLGERVFDEAMQAYFRQWKFRHPNPRDLQQVLEASSGKNLDWFFNDVVGTAKQHDLKVKSCKMHGDSLYFEIREKGYEGPFQVSFYKENTLLEKRWFEAGSAHSPLAVKLNADNIVVDEGKTTLDINYYNNSSTRKLFPSVRMSPRIKPFTGHDVYVSPAIAWNNYDKWMPGLNITNISLPFRNFEYSITPLYSWRQNEWSGTAYAEWTIPVGESFIKEVHIRQRFRKFHYDSNLYRTAENTLENRSMHYMRFQPEVELRFRKKHPRATLYTSLTAGAVFLREETFNYTERINNVNIVSKELNDQSFYRIQYAVNDKRVLDPWSANLTVEANEDILKTEVELRYRISYKMKRKGFDIRLFAGTAFNDASGGRYGYFLSDRNGVFGSNDYAYDQLYFGRSETEGWMSKQMGLRQGQFKAYTPFGQYKTWMATLNLIADIPVPLPIRVYADIGTTEGLADDLDAVYGLTSIFSYNAGLCLSIARETVEIYFPLFFSEEIKRYQETNNLRFKDNIRFVFNIAKLSPMNTRSSILR